MAKKAVNYGRNGKAFDKYLEELHRISPLGSSEELNVARLIADQEKDLWLALLDRGKMIDPVIALVENLIEKEPDRPHAERAGDLLKWFGRRFPGAKSKNRSQNSLEKAALELADKLYEVDVDRELVSGAVRELAENVKDRHKRGGRKDHNAYVSNVRSAVKRVEETKRGFIKSNLAIVVYIAQRYKNSRTHLEDLIQEGNLGLMKAVDRFDHRQGFRFSTYAAWWVKAYINRSISKTGFAIRIPEYALRDSNKLSKATEVLLVKAGRQPTDEELIEQSGLSQGYMSRMEKRAIQPVISLDDKIAGIEGRCYSDVLVDSHSKTPLESAEIEILSEDLEEVLKELTSLERMVIRWRFGLCNLEETTLKEIGDRYGLSRERIRQIQEQALDKLRQLMSSSDAA